MREIWNMGMMYIFIVNLEKEFDRVDWVKIFEVLKTLHVDVKDHCRICI